MTPSRARRSCWFGWALGLLLLNVGGATAQAPPLDSYGDDQQRLEPVLLQLVVDGTVQHQTTRVWRHDREGFLVPLANVNAWNLADDPTPLCRWIGGECYLSLDTLEGVEYRLDSARQRLAVNTSPASRRRQIIDAQRVEQPGDGSSLQPSTPALFLDYELTAEKTNGALGNEYYGGLFELGWVQGRWQASGRVLANDDVVERLSTTWTLTQPEKLAVWRLGDAVAPGGALAPPVRFAGIQWGTRFDIRPRFITYPLPSLEGVATLPSVVDLVIDGALRMRREVTAGAFEIRQPPLVDGSGLLELRLRDVAGGEHVVTQPFSVESDLLRPGLDQWSVQAGWLRRGFGLRSDTYGPAFASVDYRRGLTRQLTVEGHGTSSEDQRALAVAATWTPGRLGTLDFGVGASGGATEGVSAAGQYARLGLTHRRRHFLMAAEVEVTHRSFRWVGAPPASRQSQRLRFAYSPPKLGRLALSYLSRERADEQRVELWTASYSRSLSRRMRLRLSAFQLESDRRRRELAVGISMPFGRRFHTTTRLRARSGSIRPELEVERQAPVGLGWGLRAMVEPGPEGRGELSGILSTRIGRYRLRRVESGSLTATQLRAEGSLVAMAGSLFASRPLSRGFALVRIGHPDVRVYADNRLAGRTNRRGIALIPALRPFQENPIRVEPRDLPLSARIDRLEMDAVPYENGALLLDFPVGTDANSQFYLHQTDGTPVPAGASVERASGKPASRVGSRGSVYLEELHGADRLIVRWGGSRCTVQVTPTSMLASIDVRTKVCRGQP